MRLKLTPGVRRHRLSRLGGATRPADGRRRPPGGPRVRLRRRREPRRRRPHGCRRARARKRRQRRRRRRAPPERAAEALNAVLPDDVAVVDGEAAPADFHARHSATARRYRYRVHRRGARSPFELRRSWWHPHRLDLSALAESAELLRGEHDFRAFTPTETQHTVFVRRVTAAGWHERGDFLELEIARRLVPPPHGAHARRDDGRAEARGDRAPARRPSAQRGGIDRPALGAIPRRGRLLRRNRGQDNPVPGAALSRIETCAPPSACSTSTARSSTPGR